MESVYISIEIKEGRYSSTKIDDSVSIEVDENLRHDDIDWLNVINRLYDLVKSRWDDAQKQELDNNAPEIAKVQAGALYDLTQEELAIEELEAAAFPIPSKEEQEALMNLSNQDKDDVPF